MTKEVVEKIVRGITDKIECNTVDIDDWAEFWGFTREEYEDFLDMAIKALDQQPCEDCISREEAIRIAEQGQIQGYEWQFRKLCNLPSVTPKFTDTEIQKMQDLEQAQLEKAYELGKTEQQPCEEENPTWTECRYYDHEKHHCPRFCKVIENTMAEITSEQTRPKGKWKWKDRGGICTCKCSICGFGSWEMEFDYCPYCGADMRGKE